MDPAVREMLAKRPINKAQVDIHKQPLPEQKPDPCIPELDDKPMKEVFPLDNAIISNQSYLFLCRCKLSPTAWGLFFYFKQNYDIKTGRTNNKLKIIELSKMLGVKKVTITRAFKELTDKFCVRRLDSNKSNSPLNCEILI